jgi:outer membrane protein assembly factor BamB
MKEEISIKGKSVFLNNQHIVEACVSIEQCLAISNFIVLLLKYDELKQDRNVMAYNYKGELVWQIPEPDKFYDLNYYTKIFVTLDQKLFAYNLTGVRVGINILTGEILSKELVK